MSGILGKTFRSSVAAVRPFITGIEKSRMTICKICCRWAELFYSYYLT